MVAVVDAIEIKTTRPTSWWLAVWWALSFSIGLVTAILVHHSITNDRGGNVDTELVALGMAVVAGICLISLIQGLALRRFAPHIGWLSWIGATFAGYVLGVLMLVFCVLMQMWTASERSGYSDYMPQSAMMFLFLALLMVLGVAGGIAAAAQSVVLQPHIRGVTLWIVVSAITLPLPGLFALTPAPSVVFQWDVYLRVLGVAAIGGMFSGSISGIVLTWLLRRSPHRESILTQPPQPTQPNHGTPFALNEDSAVTEDNNKQTDSR